MKMEREGREHGGLEEDSVSVHVFRVAVFVLCFISNTSNQVLFFSFSLLPVFLTEQLRRGV